MDGYKDLREIVQDMDTSQTIMEQRVYETLKNAILEGKLQGNQVLKTDELASIFGVSRMPVRESLRALSSEGFVVFYPYRGARVTPISQSEIEELTSVRIALERMALMLLIPVPAGWKENMYHFLDEKYEQLSDNAYILNVRNTEFHENLYNCIDHTILKELLKNLRDKMRRYNILIPTTPTVKNEMLREHFEIVEACVNGSYELAAACMTKHLINFKNKIIKQMSEE